MTMAEAVRSISVVNRLGSYGLQCQRTALNIEGRCWQSAFSSAWPDRGLTVNRFAVCDDCRDCAAPESWLGWSAVKRWPR